MQLKNLGNLTSWTFDGINTLDKFVESLNKCSITQQLAVVNSKAFDTAQKKALASALGLTIAENGQVISTSTLSATQKEATTSTLGLGSAFKGLGVAIKTNPLFGAAAMDYNKKYPIKPIYISRFY